MTHATKLLIAAFTLAAVPALAQSNTANEGSAATPDGTYAKPMTPPAQAQDQDQQQAQRQANSDPYNMPRARDAYSAQDPQAQQNDEASGNGQAPSDADNGTSADRTNPAPSPKQ